MDAPKSRWRNEGLFFLAAIIVFLLDQFSKSWVRLALAPGESFPKDWPVRFTHVTNSGIAFGLLADQTFLLVVSILVTVAALVLYYRIPFLQRGWFRVTFGLLMGGALGNLVDRLRFGYVTDFLDVQVWPVFNIADSSIVIGMALLVWLSFFRKKGEPRAAPPPPQS